MHLDRWMTRWEKDIVGLMIEINSYKNWSIKANSNVMLFFFKKINCNVIDLLLFLRMVEYIFYWILQPYIYKFSIIEKEIDQELHRV